MANTTTKNGHGDSAVRSITVTRESSDIFTAESDFGFWADNYRLRERLAFDDIGNLSTIRAQSPIHNMKNHTVPSFARCVLHVRAIHRNPSQFRFYLGGIIREFTQSFSGIVIVLGFGLLLFLEIVNLFFL